MYCQFIDFAHVFVVRCFFFSYRLSSIHYVSYILKKTNHPFHILPLTFVFDVFCHISFKIKLVNIYFLYCFMLCVIP